MSDAFDIVVVGAGHAGSEAAAAAARLGCRVALVTLSRFHVGRLSCNPAIGGLAKGQLVRELDALGGCMARVTDATTIQFRRLNTRKGLAVQASRAQVDIDRYPRALRDRLERIPGLRLLEGEVAEVLVRSGRVEGVRLADGRRLPARAVILTTGTFLRARMHCGPRRTPGGRVGEGPAERLAACLRELGLRMGRLKTGTTPRLDGRTVDWSRLEAQPDVPGRFSFAPPGPRLPRRPCHRTWTHEKVHDIIREALPRAPLFNGAIEGVGPRYCPSIEDKVVRFPDRERHTVFLEPEGLDTHRVYLNGLSTSLPEDVQERMVRAIPGLERARIVQVGYAVEYDFADPRDLDHGLQHRAIPGLYLAGQVNGTSGYEEAAVQGFVAGVSAARGAAFRLGREEAYIGVLVDDLVSRGVGGEPYRMFPSRAEHRLLLREDNADRRLMPRGRALGLVDDATWAAFEARQAAIERGRTALRVTRLRPDRPTLDRLEAAGLGPLRQPASAEDLLRRPGVRYEALADALGLPTLPPEAAEQVETDVKYAGYLARARRRADRTRRMERLSLRGWRFEAIPGLSHEVVERLRRHAPPTLGAAARLPGITPAALDVLAAHAARRQAGR